MNKVVTPFDTLNDIARRSVEAGARLPSQKNIQLTWSGIGFTLGGVKMVAPMAEIAEMLVELKATRIPGVQPWVKGVANVRGRLLPLVDLFCFFHHQKQAMHRDRRVLVIEKQDLYSGLIVDQVFGMQHFQVDNFTDKIVQEAAIYSDFLLGSYIANGEPWAVFSPFLLATDRQFSNAAAH